MAILTESFEKISKDTWLRLQNSIFFQISQGEETITDNILLDLAKIKSPFLKIIPTSKDVEGVRGTDWEWWIGSNALGWLRFCVQAKKLNLKTKSYTGLTQKNKATGEYQIDILETYAVNNNAIPIYALYNFIDINQLNQYWQCNLQFDFYQFGCTYTSIDVIRHAAFTRGAKTFENIHSNPQSLPIRCLICCPHLHVIYDGAQQMMAHHYAMEKFGREVTIYQQLPQCLRISAETDHSVEFSQEEYNPDIGIYPKRILMLDLQAEQELEEQVEQNIV